MNTQYDIETRIVEAADELAREDIQNVEFLASDNESPYKMLSERDAMVQWLHAGQENWDALELKYLLDAIDLRTMTDEQLQIAKDAYIDRFTRMAFYEFGYEFEA